MRENVKIMIVEDDVILTTEIKDFLERWGYQAVAVYDFSDVVSSFMTMNPGLILMDINLPYYDGYYWCGKIREISEAPVIFISSRNDDRDKIMAMAGGGDDYVEKPFNLELLKAKIEAILRRTYRYKVKDRVYLNENICFEQKTSSLLYKDKEIDLTKSEKKTLSKLIESKPNIVSRDALMEALWATDEFVSDSTLTTLISRLRGKLSSACGSEIIRTKKGQGYYIE